MPSVRFWSLHLGQFTHSGGLLALATSAIGLLFVASFTYELSYIWKTQRYAMTTEEQQETVANINSSRISANTSSPIQHVLFLKTHKTGSTTISNIFFRYGDTRDLSFVLGQDTLIGWPCRFQLSFSLPLESPRPNFLCSHTRYNQKPMNHLFPKASAKYVTILRNPVDQCESAFNYIGLGDIYGFGRDPRKAIETFLSTVIEFEDLFKTATTRFVRNPMLFDLGLAYKFHQNVTAINNYIAFLDKGFDLVMITDYFDESVVLLKRLLRWKLDDILYFKSNERQDKEKAVGLTDQVKDSIKRWNAADDLLFRYFNETFWQKIETEGESFYDDLEAFSPEERATESFMLDKWNNSSTAIQ